VAPVQIAPPDWLVRGFEQHGPARSSA